MARGVASCEELRAGTAENAMKRGKPKRKKEITKKRKCKIKQWKMARNEKGRKRTMKSRTMVKGPTRCRRNKSKSKIKIKTKIRVMGSCLSVAFRRYESPSLFSHTLLFPPFFFFFNTPLRLRPCRTAAQTRPSAWA